MKISTKSNMATWALGNKGHHITRCAFLCDTSSRYFSISKKQTNKQRKEKQQTKDEFLLHNITVITFTWRPKKLHIHNANHVYSRGHLSGDLKWRQTEMRGIIIFPMTQQFSLLEFPIFCDIILYVTFNVGKLNNWFVFLRMSHYRPTVFIGSTTCS